MINIALFHTVRLVAVMHFINGVGIAGQMFVAGENLRGFLTALSFGLATRCLWDLAGKITSSAREHAA